MDEAQKYELETTIEELDSELISNQNDAYDKLKLPSSGYRTSSDGSLQSLGIYGSLWSNSVDDIYSYGFDFDIDNKYISPYYRIDGSSVRCIEN